MISGSALQAVTEILVQPVVMLSALAFLLGASNRQIAGFVVVSTLAWTIAPLLLSLVRTATRRLFPILLIGGAMRVCAGLLLAFTGFRIDHLTAGRIVTNLVVTYMLYQISAAVMAQASSGQMVTSIARSAFARTLSWRNLAAVIAAAIAGLAAWRMLDSDAPFDDTLGRVFLLAALSMLASTWFMLNIPGGMTAGASGPSLPLGQSLRYAAGHSAFRRFTAYRISLGLVAAIDPFIIVHGFQQLNIGIAHIGLALFAFALGHVAGHLVWPRWIGMFSPRVPLQIATLLRLVLLVWVLSLPTIIASSEYAERFNGPEVAMNGFAWGYILLGLATSVGNAGNQRYLMDIAPRGALNGLVLAANVLAGIVGLAPLGVAVLLDHFELERLLWAASGLAILALLASGLLVESRVRVRTSPGAWRSRTQFTRPA